jgi:hypothetical protein
MTRRKCRVAKIHTGSNDSENFTLARQRNLLSIRLPIHKVLKATPVRFVNASAIEAGKTRTLVGEMETIPRPNRPTRVVTADELGKPIPPPQERIVISCMALLQSHFPRPQPDEMKIAQSRRVGAGVDVRFEPESVKRTTEKTDFEAFTSAVRFTD